MYTQNPKKAETVEVNGTKLHYEIYGNGSPLILLHGYTQSSKHWESYIEDYADDYEVYLIDLTGHGKSEAFKEDLNIKSVAKDLEALLQYLKLDKVKAIGFSYGGDVLFQLAFQNPTIIEKMITIGGIGSWDINDFPQYIEYFDSKNMDLYPKLRESHQTDEQIKILLDQFKNFTVYISNEELARIQAKALIILGELDDGTSKEEVMRTHKNVKGSELWIIPNVEHGAHEGVNKEAFINRSKAFFHKK